MRGSGFLSMRTISYSGRIALLVCALALWPVTNGTAVERERDIPLSDGADTLVVPADSPVKFSSIDEHNLNTATFGGRFVLSGTYQYTWSSKGNWAELDVF